MLNIKILLLVVPLLFVVTCCGAAQDSSKSVEHKAITVIRGLPYSAHQTITITKHLQDGSEQTTNYESFEWRDAEGRSRMEQIQMDRGRVHRIINIGDPVAHRHLSWTEGESLDKEVMETHVTQEYEFLDHVPGTEWSSQQRADVVASKHNPNLTMEELGTATINGVLARGLRSFETIPGTRDANGQPLKRVHEQWRSVDELSMIVRSITDDPLTGKSNCELTILSRDNPDLSLFQPPTGWLVQLVQQ
jgi:hypothetical protein